MTAVGRTISALIFGAGLTLIGADAILFLFDWEHSGVAFCLGLAACAVSAVLSERAKPEDAIVLVGAAALLALLVIRNI